MRKKLLNNWLSTVKALFNDSPPNGWLLNWDLNRFEKKFKAIAQPIEILNTTSFDYSFCNKYEVTFRDDEETYYDVLTIRISFIVDAFTTHWTRYSKGGRSGAVITKPVFTTCLDIENKLRNFLIENEFYEVPDDWHELKIPEVELELSEKNAVTLGKCLFEDYE